MSTVIQIHFKWVHLRRLLRQLSRLDLVGLHLFGGLTLGSNEISNEARCRIPFIAGLDGCGLRLGGLPRGGLSLGNLSLGRLLRDGLWLGGLPRCGLSFGDLLLGCLLLEGLRLGGFVLRVPHHFIGPCRGRSLHLLGLFSQPGLLGCLAPSLTSMTP